MHREGFTGTERLRAAEIIGRLASSPALEGAAPLFIEYSIRNFFEAPKGAKPVRDLVESVFPALNPVSVRDLLLEVLYERTEYEVLLVLRRFIEETDFTFFDRFSNEGSILNDRRRLALYSFVKKIFSECGSRLSLNSPFLVFSDNTIEKYLPRIEKNGVAVYRLLLDFGHGEAGQQEACIIYRTVLLAMAGCGPGPAASAEVMSLLHGIPEIIIATAVKAVDIARKGEGGPCPADFAAVLYYRFMDSGLREGKTRGCLPPDRSWLETALVSRIPCFNKELLVLMRGIAADNGW